MQPYIVLKQCRLHLAFVPGTRSSDCEKTISAGDFEQLQQAEVHGTMTMCAIVAAYSMLLHRTYIILESDRLQSQYIYSLSAPPVPSDLLHEASE